MPKYLYVGSYTADAVKGVLKEGGSSRRDAVRRLIESAGGKLEAFYFAFGEDDAVVIADLPDNVTAAAVGMTVGASGGATTRTTVLLTPEEIDAASRKTVGYRAPGT